MEAKNKSKKKKIIIILIILLIILIWFLSKGNLNFFNDDIIFFKNFYSSQGIGENNNENEENQNNQIYNSNSDNVFIISTKKSETRETSLFSNISNETNWNRIIYPGTKGEFSIQLYGQENLNYQIIFQSKNQKPKNLVFNEKGRDNYYETLEALGETLTGNIEKGEMKEITIEWQWQYETNENGNMQDTKDGNELKEYNFLIIARGEEKI